MYLVLNEITTLSNEQKNTRLWRRSVNQVIVILKRQGQSNWTFFFFLGLEAFQPSIQASWVQLEQSKPCRWKVKMSSKCSRLKCESGLTATITGKPANLQQKEKSRGITMVLSESNTAASLKYYCETLKELCISECLQFSMNRGKRGVILITCDLKESYYFLSTPLYYLLGRIFLFI